MRYRLNSEPIQLIQLLKAAGVCMTGGEAKILVDEGEVRVDGEVETRKRRKLTGGMVVAVGGEEIELISPASEPGAHPGSG
jgi:ribosome-associated protein